MSGFDYLANHPRYQTVREIGEGTFGCVFLANDKETGKQVAIKFIEQGKKVTHYVNRELASHMLLWHPHVIKFKELILTPTHMGIVQEFAGGGDLYRYVVGRKRLDEAKSRWIFQQLIVAIDCLHKQGIANRDIKLENTLLTGDAERPLVKLCDFGYAKSEILHSVPNSRVGTPAYMAPELFTQKRYDGKKADVWSCGVMLYAMLVGQYPFDRREECNLRGLAREQRAIQRIRVGDYAFPADSPVSPDCQDLVRHMLEVDLNKRYTVSDIQRSPWYLTDLPAGALEMNNKRYKGRYSQSPEEIHQLLRKARRLKKKPVGVRLVTALMGI